MCTTALATSRYTKVTCATCQRANGALVGVELGDTAHCLGMASDGIGVTGGICGGV
jgi:hypothetical protein